MPISIPSSAGSRISAKRVVIDLLSTMPPRLAVSVAALVRGAAVLGIAENSVRVALARLRARGLVESDQRGLYRLSRAAEPVNRQVRSWRSVLEEVVDWDGSWIGVEESALPRADRKAARRRSRALRLLGFEALSPALRVRPNNLRGGVEALRERLAALGYSPRPFVFEIASLDRDADDRARALWDTRTLEADYASIREGLEKSAARIPSLSIGEAMAETFVLGGEAVRSIVLDPLLPEPIVDVDARRALVEAMQRYDRIGRACWKGWAGESIGLALSPADAGGLETAIGEVGMVGSIG